MSVLIDIFNNYCAYRYLNQRMLTGLLRGSITVQKTSCITGLDSTKYVNLLIILHNKADKSKLVKQMARLTEIHHFKSKLEFSVSIIKSLENTIIID